MPCDFGGGAAERGAVDVGQAQLHAEAGELCRGGKPDAAGGAGDDRGAIFGQGGVERHFISLSGKGGVRGGVSINSRIQAFV